MVNSYSNFHENERQMLKFNTKFLKTQQTCFSLNVPVTGQIYNICNFSDQVPLDRLETQEVQDSQVLEGLLAHRELLAQ